MLRNNNTSQSSSSNHVSDLLSLYLYSVFLENSCLIREVWCLIDCSWTSIWREKVNLFFPSWIFFSNQQKSCPSLYYIKKIQGTKQPQQGIYTHTTHTTKLKKIMKKNPRGVIEVQGRTLLKDLAELRAKGIPTQRLLHNTFQWSPLKSPDARVFSSKNIFVMVFPNVIKSSSRYGTDQVTSHD